MDAVEGCVPHRRAIARCLGLDIARAERPDLILLDIQLPGMDGCKVLRRLRRADATRSIPVIATGNR
jgi:CheY-like chemotaxis protein